MKQCSLLFSAALMLLCAAPLGAQDLVLNENFWETNGTVHAIEHDEVNEIVYIGGDFTYVGPTEPHGASIDQATGAVDFSFANPNGTVWASIPDGNGGWYIGGDFTEVGGEPRNRLAQIDAAGQPTSWAPDVSGSVRALLLKNNVLYAGGDFTLINGEDRPRLASFDATTGSLNAWNPRVSGTVNAIAEENDVIYIGGGFAAIGEFVSYGASISQATGEVDFPFASPNGTVWASIPDGNGGWYIGGSFTEVGGEPRNGLAQIDASGLVTDWNPSAGAGIAGSSDVLALAMAGSIVYAGGEFGSIGGQSRNRIAAIDATTGLVTSWNPNASSTVNALAVSGSSVYAGGFFTSIGGQSRNRIAALDATTGAATSWNPNANNTVWTLAVSGGTVYAGGDFTSIGGESRNRIAAIDATAGAATSWNPNASNSVRALAVTGSTVYAGGFFTSIGGQSRIYIAALNTTTGMATSWNPIANNLVRALAVSGSTVYAGGNFTSIGGQSRYRLAALDASTGTVTGWNPNANANASANWFSTLAVSGSTVYAGGDFTSIGGQSRNRIAALDATTGAATSWNPNASSTVRALAVSGSTVYAGGFFTIIGGQFRPRIAALDATTGAATSWNPNASNWVSALAVSGSTVYAGGFFTSIGGQSRNRIAALDATTGAATSWNPNASSLVWTLAVSGSTVYAGGDFTSIGGESRSRIAALDATTGTATSWNPSAGSTVYALAVSGSTVYAGGQFTSIGGQSRNLIAALDATTGTATSWNPNANASVFALAVSGNTVYAGGGFTSIGGESRSRIAALDATTGAATSWNPNASSTVRALAVSGSTVYAGGFFTSIGGESRNRIAALDATTGAATSWNPNANNTVWTLAVSGSTVYAGGDFISIGGESRNRIAALDATTGTATNWNPNAASSRVNCLAVSGNIVYAGGSFTSIGGESRSRIAALDATTGTATSWNPNASSTVLSLAVSGSTVYAGGTFTSIGGQSRNNIAALNASTGNATSWNPNANLSVNSLSVSGSTVYAGGNFTSIGGKLISRFAAFDICNAPELPLLSSTTNPICPGSETTLSITSGELNDATDWQWYTESCGGTLVGTGTSIQVSPEETTTYYVRGEGGCVTPGDCAEITITVNPAATGTDVQTACGTFTWIDGNTYTESNTTAQFNIVEGAVNGCDSLVTLNLTITGAIDECGICYEDGDSDPDWNQSCADCEGVPNGPALPGNPCDDGSACTFNDTYDNDCNCVGTPVNCDDGNPCTFDSCDPIIGCTYINLPDTDGDGICDEQDSCPFLFGEIGDNCTTGSGDPGVINGDCECIALAINGCTDPEACNYDAAATDDDGSCFYVCNDIAEDALELPITALGTCDGLPQDMTNALTNNDLWYSFTASTAGVRIEVTTADFDAVIELLDNGLTVVASADLSAANAGEVINFGNLIAGDTYLLRVASNATVNGSAPFEVCVQWLPDTRCDFPSGTYSLCNPFKAKWVSGGVDYIFKFTPTSGGPTLSYATGAAFTVVLLQSVPGLLWDTEYDLAIDVVLNLTDGLGVNEPVVVSNSEPCSIEISSAPTAALRPQDNLMNAGPLFAGQYIAATPWICTTAEWEWEFVNTNGIQLPVVHLSGGPSRFVRLLDVPGLQPGDVYDVRVRPVFPTGAASLYGGVDQIALVGALGLTEGVETPVLNDEPIERLESGSLPSYALYPNPNRGDYVNVNIANIEAEVDRVLLDIYDLVGKRVASAQMLISDSRSVNGVLPLNDLAGGMYLVNIYINDEVRTERLVIQK